MCIIRRTYGLAAVAILMMAASCKAPLVVTNVEGGVISVDSTWDAVQNEAAVELLRPYKAVVDSTMGEVLGVCDVFMNNSRPEDRLQNLVSDVLRQAAVDVIGRPADLGLVNVGGLRSSLAKGDVTRGDVFEILPFENSLCVLTVDGVILRRTLEAIAARGGEGVSGVRMVITKDGKLIESSVGDEQIDDTKLYTIATIDYLSGGNDGMTPLLDAKESVCPPDATLRDIFLRYLNEQTKTGKKLSAEIEGRIIVK